MSIKKLQNWLDCEEPEDSLDQQFEISEDAVLAPMEEAASEVATSEEEGLEGDSSPQEKTKSRGIPKNRSIPPKIPMEANGSEKRIPISPEDSEENLITHIQGTRSRSVPRREPVISSPEERIENDVNEIRASRIKKARTRLAQWSENTGEPGMEHFYKYLVWHPSFLQRVVTIAGTIVLLICAFITYQFFMGNPPVPPVYQRIEGIKRLGELHLVKQHYESIIPIFKEPGEVRRQDPELQFLLIAPVEVSGFLDFSKIKLELKADSLAVISFPEPEISKVYLDFRKTEEYLSKGKLRIFGKYIERLDYTKAYYDIAIGINENKKKVTLQAEANGIKDETLLKAELFLRNFLNSLGYRVEFLVSEPSPGPAATEAVADESQAQN
ncbi:MAG: DUF4230 domain-containing protein [Bacteroidia bacterium]